MPSWREVKRKSDGRAAEESGSAITSADDMFLEMVSLHPSVQGSSGYAQIPGGIGSVEPVYQQSMFQGFPRQRLLRRRCPNGRGRSVWRRRQNRVFFSGGGHPQILLKMPGLNVEIGVELDDPFNQILKFPDIALQGELEQQLFGIGASSAGTDRCILWQTTRAKCRASRITSFPRSRRGGMFKRRVLRR